MEELFYRAHEAIFKFLWETDVSSVSRFKRILIHWLRVLYAAIRTTEEEELLLRATGLVYTTLLSLVPLLAVAFSILKALGVYNHLVPLLGELLAPLGPTRWEIISRVVEFVDRAKVGVLGSIGAVFLVYTGVSLVQNVDGALNATWKSLRSRDIARRAINYLSFLFVGPVLVSLGLGMSAFLADAAFTKEVLSIAILGKALAILGRILPLVLIVCGFTFLYKVSPNTRVALSAALLGGVVAGVLWEAVGWLFTSFIVTSTRYSTIYSGFATLILFMIWLYLSWFIFLFGAAIAFSYQYPYVLTLRKESPLYSSRFKERLSLVILYLITDRYLNAGPSWSLESLAHHLAMPLRPILRVILQLEEDGVIVEAGDGDRGFLPARDPDTLGMTELLELVRRWGGEVGSIEQKFLSIPPVDDIVDDIEKAIQGVVGERKLRSLVSGVDG